MANALKVGIAGLGTVGAGTVRVLEAQAALLAARAGREIKVTAVAARERARDRGVKLDGYMGWLSLTCALSITACPILALPGGFTPDLDGGGGGFMQFDVPVTAFQRALDMVSYRTCIFIAQQTRVAGQILAWRSPKQPVKRQVGQLAGNIPKCDVNRG